MAGVDKKDRKQRVPTDHRPELVRFLASRVRDPVDAQDLAQEVYLRFSRVKEQDLIENPAAYLFRIAANLVGEHMMRRKHVTVDLETLEEIGGDGDGDAFDRKMEARSDIRRLEGILETLPPLYRAVLLLRKRDGLSHAEIAEKLGISPHTVHQYLTRALASCRAAWTE